MPLPPPLPGLHRRLQAALPRLGAARRSAGLATIPGQVPEPGALPPGCPFHPRCPDCIAVCKTDDPKLVNLTPTHRAACHVHAPPD